MKQRLLYALFILLGFGLITSCEMDDDEPAKSTSISRLYISYSNWNPNVQGTPINNMAIVSNADSTNFGDARTTSFYLTPSSGGSTIYFHPAARAVFHASLNISAVDTIIHTATIGETGAPANNRKIMSKLLMKPRGLVFHPHLDRLYTVQVNEGSSYVYVFDKPRGINQVVIPSQTIELAGQLNAWDATIVNSKLILSRTGKDGGLDIFDNLVPRREPLIPNLSPSKSLKIVGTSNIQGISIDTVNNMMAVADYPDNNSVAGAGRILIFDNFTSLLEGSETITPSRIITGANTKLIRPSDVDLDFRKDSKYFYVADPGSSLVYRFLKSADGNVAPESQFSRAGLNPVSLSLDARN